MDAAFPYTDEPAKFADWLFERLSQIPNISWDRTTLPMHTSYGRLMRSSV